MTAPPAENAPDEPDRTHVLTGLTMVCLVLAMGAVLLADHWARWRSDVSTAIGERKELPLSDGSRITLNTGSALNYEVTEHARSVELLEGEAYFAIAPDADRAFVLRAGDITIRVVGTQFNVSKVGDITKVSVDRGTVEIDAGKTAPIRLEAGQELSIAMGVKSEPRAFDTATTTAWRSGRLSFAGAQLNEVVADLNRYRSGFILLSGGVQQLPVNAVFDNDDIDAAVLSIEQSLGLHSVRLGSWFVFLYR